MNLLKEQVVFISGADTGLGRAYAEHLVSQGACVIINDIAMDSNGNYASVTAADEIQKAGGNAVADHTDNSDRAKYPPPQTKTFPLLKHNLVENFYQILDEHDRIEDNEQRSAHNPIINKNDGFEIHIQDIWFRYPSQEQYVLRGVNLVINRNETLSLVGKNGSGKTTLVKLILRLYKPERGKIYINGIDINQISLTEYYKLLSVVFQDFQIFAFSIRDNILMSAIPDPDNNSENEQRDATMARVKSAIRSAGLAPDIQNLEKKENTFLSKELSDDGIEFSGGMMQKLAMARAYYKDSKLIILDEPTAMLDPLQEYEIYKHFNELIKMQSAIFISHRMSSCRFCDKIAVLNNGVIEEYGTHDELIQQKGLYSFLYGSQAEKYSFY